MEANPPPRPSELIVASVPPQIIISAAPRSMILKESQMGCAEAEQAVQWRNSARARRSEWRRGRKQD